MFKNMKLGAKVLLGFIVLTVIAMVIGVVGTVNINKIVNADTALYERVTLRVQYIGAITTDFNQIRVKF